MKILFVSDAVTPFCTSSGAATIVRNLPEQLYNEGGYEMRIMMPRYGVVSERKNRLHEVIRLSGTRIKMATRTETLKVKVASIPGTRLQVYFMDNNQYFKRKGVYRTAQNPQFFEDNMERALFFGRASLETIRKLGWAPDVIHAFGWLSGFVPMLLQTEYAGEDIFGNTQSVFTPIAAPFDDAIDDAFADAERLDHGASLVGKNPNGVGSMFSDATISLSHSEDTPAGAVSFGDTPGEQCETARAAYEQLLRKVAA